MSEQTTNLGPQVSQRTTLAHGGLSTGTWEVPSWVTFDADGKVDLTDAATHSRQTSSSYDSTSLEDGEFAVGDVSATSAVVYFRSGVTTYRFLADAAGVL